MKEPMVFKLSKNLSYGKEGDFEETGEVTIDAPSMKCFAQLNRLSQLAMHAISDNNHRSAKMRAELGLKELPEVDESDDAEDDMKPDVAKIILMSSTTVDFNDVVAEFKNILKVSGWVGEKTKFPIDLFNQLEIEDIQDMVSGYISNFIYPSIL